MAGEQGSANGNKSLVRTSLQAQRVWDGPAESERWLDAGYGEKEALRLLVTL